MRTAVIEVFTLKEAGLPLTSASNIPPLAWMPGTLEQVRIKPSEDEQDAILSFPKENMREKMLDIIAQHTKDIPTGEVSLKTLDAEAPTPETLTTEITKESEDNWEDISLHDPAVRFAVSHLINSLKSSGNLTRL